MTVYPVINSRNKEFKIEGIFSSSEKADDFIERNPNRNLICAYTEVYELDGENEDGSFYEG